MKLLQFSVLAFSLVASTKAYDITFYDTDKCTANKDSNYLIYTGSSSECINIGSIPQSDDLQCSQYTNGGFADPAACGVKGFDTKSILTTTLKTNDRCRECLFYLKEDCESMTTTHHEGVCAEHGGKIRLKSFKCVSSNSLGGCL